MTQLNVAIIGAGMVGAFYDTPRSKNILTHAHAYNKHKGFNLVGFVDKDYKKAQQAVKVWGGKAYKDIASLFSNEHIDALSSCVPDEAHYATCQELRDYELLGGILEKPLTSNLTSSYQLLKDPYFLKRPFLVNYHRRYVRDFQLIANKIKSGKYGRFLCGNIYYGKGLIHNGSHMIDLLSFWGINISSSNTYLTIDDFHKKDLSYSAVLFEEGGGSVTLNVVPASMYKNIEMDLCFENKRIRMLDGGLAIEEYGIENDKIFPGYKIPVLKKSYRTKLSSAMYYTVDNLYNSIVYRKRVMCTISDGYNAQKICEDIRKS